jgi:glycosyltransferase involved in cell wall biosynthesis
MPSMDEEGTIGACIEKVRKVFAEQQLDGEIIVADNSTDRTPEIARSLGAIVITPEQRGYGNAYLAGLAHATGQYIVTVVAPEREEIFDFWIKVPEAEELNPIVQIIPIQFLAYELAILRFLIKRRGYKYIKKAPFGCKSIVSYG